MRIPARRIAGVGVMAALALTLSFIESLFLQMPFLPPGAKLGLSNIAVLLAAGTMTLPDVLCIALIKSMFVASTRGLMAGALSLAGGVLSALCMTLLLRARRVQFSYLFVSVGGAVCHGIGQLLILSVWIGGRAAAGYLPFLLLTGIVMGGINAVIMQLLAPIVVRK